MEGKSKWRFEHVSCDSSAVDGATGTHLPFLGGNERESDGITRAPGPIYPAVISPLKIPVWRSKLDSRLKILHEAGVIYLP